MLDGSSQLPTNTESHYYKASLTETDGRAFATSVLGFTQDPIYYSYKISSTHCKSNLQTMVNEFESIHTKEL